jgi:ATP-binding cassette subfamily B protein
LDNCTSALDSRTEERLQGTLNRILQGRSAIVISHRVSSVMNCAEIAVLDSGRVAERGSAGDLVNASGYFSTIQRYQAGLA